MKLYNFKNAASGFNFLSTDANGYLKFKPLKPGNGISSIGDSLYLGGDFKRLQWEDKESRTYFELADGYFQINLSNLDDENYSIITAGNGAMTLQNQSGDRKTALELYNNQLIFNDGRSDKFTVDNNGRTNITNLKVYESINFDVYHTSDFTAGDLDLRDAGSVWVLDNLTQNAALILPDPSAQAGRIYYLFNANTSEVFHFTTNYPIYKSGNISYTIIPGNVEFRIMIISDGTKWLQLN